MPHEERAQAIRSDIIKLEWYAPSNNELAQLTVPGRSHPGQGPTYQVTSVQKVIWRLPIIPGISCKG
jgi:hypothetical protein